MTRPQYAFAQPDKDPSGHAPRTNREAPTPARPLPLAANSMSILQRTIGNQAVQRLLVSIQRFIQIGPKQVAAGRLAFDYTDKFPNAKTNFTRVKAACETIERNSEVFVSEDAAYNRITQLLQLLAERAVQPLVREPQAERVATELEYYPGDILPQLRMEFYETYESSWDQGGGWGAEYRPTQPGADNPVSPNWVIHVHRGDNGGLKAARVKLFSQRTSPQSGSVLTSASLNRLGGYGILGQDRTITHTQRRS